MSRPSTRKSAVDAAGKPGSGLETEPGALGPGLREWFGSLGRYPVKGAAFDTKQRPAMLTGRASRGVTRLLRAHGFDIIVPPESFLVDRRTQLGPQEAARAREWGIVLATAASRAASHR